MFSSRSLYSLAVLLVTVNGTPTVKRRVSDVAPRSASPLPAAEFSVAFSGTTPRSKAKKSIMQSLRSSLSSQAGSNFTAVLAGSDFDEEYLTSVTLGNQKFEHIVDTGSSDTWAPTVGFSCFNLEGEPVPQSTCAFGTAGFDTTASPTFKPFPDTNFNITYGDGEFLAGTAGFDTVTVAGMAVKGQEIGIAVDCAWEGDGVNTGLMGLASPNLTSVFKGTNPAADEFPQTQLPYNSIFYSAVQQGLVSHPFFSVALDRGSFAAENNSLFDNNLGFLAFGGIAPVPVTDTAVTVPIQGYNAATFLPENATRVTYFYYTVDVESMSFTGNKKVFGTTNNIILDTGTTLAYVPTDVANAFAAAFDPPAIMDEELGLYVVTCSATVPEFTVNIGGKTFTVDPADNLLPLGENDAEGNPLCISGTVDNGPVEEGNIFILGDTFLHNVVVTFDIETEEVTLTQRQKYTNGGTGATRRAPASVRRRNL
jgi:hypothetical protein